MDGYQFKMGWLLVVFDLPVMSREQRKRATDFRKYLLDEGFIMVQWSVYTRALVSHNRMDTQMRRLKLNIPPEGHVRALYVTQAQWERMFIMHGPPETETAPEKLPEQLLFW